MIGILGFQFFLSSLTDTWPATEPLGRKNGQDKQLDKKDVVLFKQHKKREKRSLMSGLCA